ncbi:MAG: hypothetical protein K9H26_07710 [Prolixibacteraceae bacterium]|nr:hypothetical protein [Prolixibacteraceae bacterium]
MKAQLRITLMLIAVLATVSIAKAENTKRVDYLKNNLRETLRLEVQNDILEPFNFLYRENVNRMKEDVDIIFHLTEDAQVKVIAIKSDNLLAKNYVMQLFKDKTLDVDKKMTGKNYHFILKIDYRAI